MCACRSRGWWLAGLALGIGVLAWRYHELTTGAGPSVPARDPWLQRQPVMPYPARDRDSTRLLLALFGNDVGFWGPHRALASHLSQRDDGVAGVLQGWTLRRLVVDTRRGALMLP